MEIEQAQCEQELVKLLPTQMRTLELVWVRDDVWVVGALLLGRSRWPSRSSSVAKTSDCRCYSSMVIVMSLIANAVRGRW